MAGHAASTPGEAAGDEQGERTVGGPVDTTEQGGGYGDQPSYPQTSQGYGQPPRGGGHGPPAIPPTNAGWAVAATLFIVG